MQKSRLTGVLCAVIFGLFTLPSYAALTGVLPTTVGGTDWQTYYDDVADLTWLQDANAAVGSIYDTYEPGSGRMNWIDANSWAASLNVVGVTGWRLPNTLQPDASCSGQSPVGSAGYDCTGSEMGNMFYNVLGGVARNSIVDTHNANYGLFSNLFGVDYVSLTEVASDTTQQWHFDFPNGFQGIGPISDPLYAWAVHDGDVSAVPTPAALYLFGSGLLGLVAIARRKAG